MMTLDRLRRQGLPDDLPVIVERTSGLVVDRLLSAGHPVVPVHPTAFFATRPRWGASGAKSDPGNSYKLADYLRTDGHRLRRLSPLDTGLQELPALVRLRDDHVRARTATSNQLAALLDAHWPGPRQLFASLMSPIALSFLTDYPTPIAAAHLGEARMASFLRRHHYRGGKKAADLVARLRAAPVAPAGLPTATFATMITAQVQLLRTLQQLISDTERLIAARVVAHPRTGLLAGFWEFPSVESATSRVSRAARDIADRLLTGLPAALPRARRIGPVKHAFSHRIETYHPFIFAIPQSIDPTAAGLVCDVDLGADPLHEHTGPYVRGVVDEQADAPRGDDDVPFDLALFDRLLEQAEPLRDGKHRLFAGVVHHQHVQNVVQSGRPADHIQVAQRRRVERSWNDGDPAAHDG